MARRFGTLDDDYTREVMESLLGSGKYERMVRTAQVLDASDPDEAAASAYRWLWRWRQREQRLGERQGGDAYRRMLNQRLFDEIRAQRPARPDADPSFRRAELPAGGVEVDAGAALAARDLSEFLEPAQIEVATALVSYTGWDDNDIVAFARDSTLQIQQAWLFAVALRRSLDPRTAYELSAAGPVDERQVKTVDVLTAAGMPVASAVLVARTYRARMPVPHDSYFDCYIDERGNMSKALERIGNMMGRKIKGRRGYEWRQRWERMLGVELPTGRGRPRNGTPRGC